MTPFGLQSFTQKCLALAVTAAFALTLAPANALCDSHTVLGVLMQMGKPKKPKADCCQGSECCQDSVCTGARTMPCCPNKPCTGCDTQCCEKCCPKPCGGCD